MVVACYEKADDMQGLGGQGRWVGEKSPARRGKKRRRTE